jgi:uncharacterized membrane protein HdeD (DUF308 family)
MTQHAVFYAVGMILGVGGGTMMVQSFSEDHPRNKVLAIVIPLSLITGLVLGWSLNAWLDFVHASAQSGS